MPSKGGSYIHDAFGHRLAIRPPPYRSCNFEGQETQIVAKYCDPIGSQGVVPKDSPGKGASRVL